MPASTYIANAIHGQKMLSEGTTGDFDSIVADMKEVAIMGLQQNPPIRFVYEAMAWGAHIDT